RLECGSGLRSLGKLHDVGQAQYPDITQLGGGENPAQLVELATVTGGQQQFGHHDLKTCSWTSSPRASAREVPLGRARRAPRSASSPDRHSPPAPHPASCRAWSV